MLPTRRTLLVLSLLASFLFTALHAGSSSPSVAAAGITSTAGVPAKTSAGSALSIAVSVTSDRALSALIDVEIYSATGAKVYQQVFENRSLTAGRADSITATWQIPASQPVGAHTVKVGVFGPGWTPVHHWNDRAAAFDITAGAKPNLTTTATASPTSLGAGATVGITASVTSETPLAALVDIEIYGPAGTRVFQKFFDNQSLPAQRAASFSASWPTPAASAAGTYVVKVAVFSPGWASVYHWNDRAAAFAVTGSTPAQPPSSGQRFATLPPGSALPSGQECANRVRRSPWEPRPGNARENATVPTSTQIGALKPWTRNTNGVDDRADLLRGRIDGQFTGTTDEIIQWGACKWGLDEDIVRAVAVQESWWRQQTEGDYNATTKEYESYGLLQVRKTAHTVTFPTSKDSTPFNVDFALAWRRACYEGYILWLNDVQPGAGYRSGDEWGCVGFWFSGRWKDDGANRYIGEVQRHLSEKTWLKPEFR